MGVVPLKEGHGGPRAASWAFSDVAASHHQRQDSHVTAELTATDTPGKAFVFLAWFRCQKERWQPARLKLACADPSAWQADIQTAAREPGSRLLAQEAWTMVLRHWRVWFG